MDTDNVLGLGIVCLFGAIFLIGLYLIIFKAVPAPVQPAEYTLVNEV
jgi:hypothetical protein